MALYVLNSVKKGWAGRGVESINPRSPTSTWVLIWKYLRPRSLVVERMVARSRYDGQNTLAGVYWARCGICTARFFVRSSRCIPDGFGHMYSCSKMADLITWVGCVSNL